MKIIVFSKNNCQYCTKAKSLLDSLNLEFDEVKLEDFSNVQDFIDEIGKQVRTMPQIKIDGELIGGYNQLVEHFADQKKVNYKGEIISE